MKGIDTNVLVRYLVQDDPTQSEKASQFIEKMVADGEDCLINNIVLCELIWVLESAYDYKKEQIAIVIESLLSRSMFEFENRDAISWSLHQYRTSKADFSDCLIARKNQEQGCVETVSFDKGVKKVEGFRVL